MSKNEELITRFYQAFSKQDWKTMQQCYHPNCTFSDPAFLKLNANQTRAMWHMLCEAAQNFSLTYSSVQADNTAGSCHWEAQYDFSRTGRKVYNIIEAHFTFQDGKIITHRDKFDLWRWSRMALGAPGYLLGWSPIVQDKIRATAMKSLEKFLQNHPEYQS